MLQALSQFFVFLLGFQGDLVGFGTSSSASLASTLGVVLSFLIRDFVSF
jgi:hypothetical protein